MNKDIKYWTLKDHKLFKALNNSQIEDLCILKKFHSVKKGEIIYFSNENVPRVYILDKGILKIVSINEDGTETIKDIIHKGDLFGEIFLDENDVSDGNEYAQALSTDVRLCTFKAQDLEKILENNPSLALSYTKFMGLKIKRIHNRYSNLMGKEVRTRLVMFLKDWSQTYKAEEDGRVIVQNYLTQDDIAKIICSTRQTVTELMSKLEQEGQLVYDRKQIIIKNLNALK
jgi:CRP-like cAMP-binding protein